MIRSFRKFFEFAGRQSRNWYLGLFYEIIRCILEALQFAALLVVLDGLVRDNITAQTALLAFGIMLVSVIGTIIFWYLAHGNRKNTGVDYTHQSPHDDSKGHTFEVAHGRC